MSFLNAMERAYGKQPIEKWGLPAIGWLRMKYCSYKYRDYQRLRAYEELYVKMYWAPIRDSRNMRRVYAGPSLDDHYFVGSKGWKKQQERLKARGPYII